MGPGVPVIDSGVAIARRVRDVLASHGLLTASTGAGALSLMTSGEAAIVEPVARFLLGEDIPVTTVQTSHAVLDCA
jgi:glutamate racemase